MPTVKIQSDKFRELLLYIAERSEADPKFGGTKLNKIMFYADFLAYRDLGKAITGVRYQKLPFGPAAVPLLPALQEMEAQGELVVRHKFIGPYKQNKPIALRPPNLTDFSADEIALVDAVISYLWDFGASGVSDLSHEVVGWQVAAEREDIPYSTAFVESIRAVPAVGEASASINAG